MLNSEKARVCDFFRRNAFAKNRKHMVKLIFTLFLFSGLSAFAQTGYEIEVTLKGLRDTSCILGHYNYSRSAFIARDTARADAEGRMVFRGDSLPGGIYLVVLPGNAKWAELIYSGKEKRFSLSSDTTDIIRNMVVSGSRENQFFYDFQQTMERNMGEIARLSKANPQDPAIEKLRKETEEYRKNAIAQNPDLLVSKFLKAIQVPEIPPAPKLPNGREDSVWVFNYYKTHYWDNIDFNDDRLLRTPIMQNKMEQYVKNLIVQHPDSLIREADALIARSQNKEFRHFLIRYFATEYENPKTVGTEGVFVHMAEKYYLGGEISLSEDGKRRIADRVRVLKPLLVNRKFPDAALWNEQKQPFNLSKIPAEYLVVFFYSPTCGHCKESAPKLVEFYEQFKSQGVKVAAIATESSEEEWKKFISEQKIGGMINGYDFSGQIDYREQFDVLATPTIYILDKEKRIIARKMPVEQLGDFLNFYKRKVARK
mgnify:FL=1